ncbi:MAG: hypothetical protein MJ187_04615 [Alphaproteobacteria bacterium]|nr:hypothetical protein [Alphaproteobacteria bacterium]
MKIFHYTIMISCIILNHIDAFSACSSCGTSECSQVFSNCRPIGTDPYAGPVYAGSQICCSSWTSSSDGLSCSCSSANITSGSAAGRTITNTITGNKLKFNGGDSSGGTTTAVKCTEQNCSNARVYDSNGTMYCFIATFSTCTGNTNNTTGQAECARFGTMCKDGKGVDGSGNTVNAPLSCKNGYHKYLLDCIIDCKAGEYPSNLYSECSKCPEYLSSGKYGTSPANANSITDCFLSAGTSITDSKGTFQITEKCNYER